MARKPPIKSPIGPYLRQDVPIPEWLQRGKTIITPEVEAELTAMGFPIPDWVKVVPYSPKEMTGAVYVCRAIAEGDPEGLPDNVVDKCGLCSTRIEHRPTAPKDIFKICGECAEARANRH